MAFLRLQKRLLGESETLQKNDFFWALKILCGLKKIDIHAFPKLIELTTPYTIDLLIRTAKLFGLRILKVHRPSCRISGKTLPSLALSCINDSTSEGIEGYELRLDLIVGSSAGKITYMPALGNQLIKPDVMSMQSAILKTYCSSLTEMRMLLPRLRNNSTHLMARRWS